MLSALEIRIIAYGILAFGLIGGTAYTTWHLTSEHYNAILAADRAAQEQAVLVQQQKVIAAQEAAQLASVAAEKQYEDLKTVSDARGAALARSVREYTALRGLFLSKAPAASTRSHATGAGAASDQRLAELSGRAAQACEQDAAELTALQSWVRSTTR